MLRTKVAQKRSCRQSRNRFTVALFRVCQIATAIRRMPLIHRFPGRQVIHRLLRFVRFGLAATVRLNLLLTLAGIESAG